MKKAVLFILMVFFSCFNPIRAEGENLSLRQLAETNRIRIGAAVTPYYFAEPDYVNTLTNEFDTVTPENQLKWAVLRPEENEFDFSSADSVVAFAVSNGMSVRGHNLVWHFMNPDWLDRGAWTRNEMTNLLYQHISKVVGRYRGVIREWDVVNEPLNDDGAMRKSIWMNLIGPDYIEYAFRWAHQADPDAMLFLNDYDTEMSPVKSVALYELVRKLLRKKVPIHGVGFQCHWDLNRLPNRSVLRKNMKKFSDLGLLIEITEADVRFKGAPTEDKLKRQAKAYEMMLKTALSIPQFRGFVLWGLTDKYSWIPYFFQDYGNALIFDGDYVKKPGYFAIRNVLWDNAVSGEKR